jgi:hypothetical protein
VAAVAIADEAVKAAELRQAETELVDRALHTQGLALLDLPSAGPSPGRSDLDQ